MPNFCHTSVISTNQIIDQSNLCALSARRVLNSAATAGLVWGGNSTARKSNFNLLPRIQSASNLRGCLETLSFRALHLPPTPYKKWFDFLRSANSTTATTTDDGESHKRGKMGSATYRNPTININQNVGNVTDSYKNVWNISVSDEKRQILEWLSPVAARERHQAVREGRVDGVGGRLLRTNEFEEWHTTEDQVVHPLLFCYGDPGVGKTYLRFVKVAPFKYWYFVKLT